MQNLNQQDIDSDNSSSSADDGADIHKNSIKQDKIVFTQAENDKKAEAHDDKKKKNPKKKRNIWWIKAGVISLVLGGFFSFISQLTASAEQIVVIILLLGFLILASILFDAIGVAVTSCDSTPIISMASRKVYGAKTALWLVKNSGTVSSVCNDIIGDIFGIISGACSAAIVVKIVAGLDPGWERWLSIIISAIVSALTIGGKAFMKNVAINNSKDFVMFVARLLAPFSKEERKIRKKNKTSKKNSAQGKSSADKNSSTDKNGSNK